jgi:energy-coupling factor transporter transmembrane protein EcfT
MLALLTKVSKKLFPFRWFSYVLLSCLTVFIVSQLFFFPAEQKFDNSYLVLSFLCCLWLLLAHVVIVTFNDIPQIAPDEKSKRVRYKIKIKRAGYYLFGLLFFALTLAIIFFSLRLIRTL